SLVRNLNGSFTRTLPDGTKLNYDSAGLLVSRVRLDSRMIRYNYIDTADADTNAWELSSIIDSTTTPGRQVTFNYDATGRLSEVRDWLSTPRVTAFQHDSFGNTTVITLPDGS